MIVGSRFWATRDTTKTPSVQLASEGGKLGLLEVFRQDSGSKLLRLVDDKSLAVWEPSDDIRVRLFGKNVKELRFMEQRMQGLDASTKVNVRK